MSANPRQAALQALLEWEKGKAFSDEILHTLFERRPLRAPDRAFIREVFFGVLRNLSALDFLIAQLRPTGQLDDRPRALLRLGLYQLFHLRVAPHAAVHETVELGGPTRGLINAILRRALREKPALERQLAGTPLETRASHPDFLLARWRTHFGEEATQALCAWDNQPAEVYARVNGLKVTRGELLRSAPGAEPSPLHSKVVHVRHLPSSWLEQGLCYVQDPSTLLACELLDPRPGEVVLDACAAPGGKTIYLAELMCNEGRLIACDLYESRVARLRENLQRLGVTNTEALVHDTMQMGGPLRPATFDRILIDAPCSNTGVLRRRVDVRWRLTEEDFIRMPAQQLALLRRAAQVIKPGGAIVYSTCSLEPEENDQVVEQALAQIPGLTLIEKRRALPFADGVDGAFAAKFTFTPLPSSRHTSPAASTHPTTG